MLKLPGPLPLDAQLFFAIYSATIALNRLYKPMLDGLGKVGWPERERWLRVMGLQALVLFLLACRHFYDPHTYWILTGVAIRIGQRMGLQRDGEKLGLPPFEVQMRRRLFYQLLPLDGLASQLSGTAIGIVPDTWDTERPSNINDDQIWPGMTEKPEEQKGATEMMFCLTRSCVGKFFARTGAKTQGAAPWQFKDYDEAELVIKEAESEVEEKFIRYCDMVNPLHFLAIGLARSGISAMRLRIRLPLRAGRELRKRGARGHGQARGERRGSFL